MCHLDYTMRYSNMWLKTIREGFWVRLTFETADWIKQIASPRWPLTLSHSQSAEGMEQKGEERRICPLSLSPPPPPILCLPSHSDSSFPPLDSALDWNYIAGSPGSYAFRLNREPHHLLSVVSRSPVWGFPQPSERQEPIPYNNLFYTHTLILILILWRTLTNVIHIRIPWGIY